MVGEPPNPTRVIQRSGVESTLDAPRHRGDSDGSLPVVFNRANPEILLCSHTWNYSTFWLCVIDVRWTKRLPIFYVNLDRRSVWRLENNVSTTKRTSSGLRQLVSLKFRFRLGTLGFHGSHLLEP